VVATLFFLCTGSVHLIMAEWKYDQFDGEDENGDDDESTSSVS